MMVVMFTMIMIVVVFMGMLIFALFFGGWHVIMKLWNLMIQWLDEGFPDFFLLYKAFDLNLVIDIILDVTGNSSFDDNLYFPFRNNVSSDPQVSLEYDGFLGDT